MQDTQTRHPVPLLHATQAAFKPQAVRLGRSVSGIPGLFTGAYMAMPVSEDNFAVMSRDRSALERYAARLGFVLEN